MDFINELNENQREAVVNTEGPTLVIAGTKDMIKESHTREIAENLPHAKLMLIRGDHFVANRHPAAFNRAVDDFLNEVTLTR